MDETRPRLEFDNEGDGKEYEVEAIRDSAVYTKELDSSQHLQGLYYLVSWKDYPEEDNTSEPALAVLHLCKLISTFYHDYPEKSTATFSSIDSTPPMVRPIAESKAETSSTKQKRGRLAKANGTSKCAKNS